MVDWRMWIRAHWRFLHTRPSRWEFLVVLLVVSSLLAVGVARISHQAAQVARQEQLVRQGMRLVEQMTTNLDQVTHNLRTMRDLIGQERARPLQGDRALAAPPAPIIELPQAGRIDAPLPDDLPPTG
jgi:hypothetical protein